MRKVAYLKGSTIIATDDFDDNVQLGANLTDITDINPQPDVGWTFDGTNWKGIRKIHKPFFINRLKPWWADIQAAQNADPIIDNYFAQFGHFSHVDLDWPVTIQMVDDLVAAVIAVNPSSDINAAALLQDGSLIEAYGSK